jgi:hypothetical protein
MAHFFRPQRRKDLSAPAQERGLRAAVAGRSCTRDRVGDYQLMEAKVRNLLRFAKDDLKNPSGYLVICALGVLGLVMAAVVHF